MTAREAGATSFGARAEIYEIGRPEYPAAALQWLLEPLVGFRRRPRVADVGAGTGKLTRGLLEAGCEVIAIDPDVAMLRSLRDNVSGVSIAVVGTAESLPLADKSVDAVTLGQAWHWVDPAAGSREVGRVLRPDGVLGLLWNLRDESEPWVARLNAVMPAGKAASRLAAGSPPVVGPFDEPQEQAWRWSRRMTRSTLLDMARSRSFFITATPERRAAYERDLNAVLDECAGKEAATLELPYLTRAYRSRRR